MPLNTSDLKLLPSTAVCVVLAAAMAVSVAAAVTDDIDDTLALTRSLTRVLAFIPVVVFGDAPLIGVWCVLESVRL